MESPAREIARRLGENAEAVCRRYLSNGRREGQYWIVGDLQNNRGRSLYVRLSDGDQGSRSGKWTDAATGDHGDLLDIIAANGGHARFGDTLAEARRFLSLPLPDGNERNPRARKSRSGSTASAKRLWAATRPIEETVVRRYLAGRSVTLVAQPSIRFHPHCYYRPSEDDAPDLPAAWPAMIAAVTDEDDRLHGVHRTWIDPVTSTKAPVALPRRAMGNLLGHGVRFGAAANVMVAGEGIETMLSVREVAPALPLIAGLSSAHLAAIRFPIPVRRLYVARERDPAGAAAFETLAGRARSCGIEVHPIDSIFDDLNSDLCLLGSDALVALLASQLVPDDAAAFLRSG
ncbi:MAG: toprim domain-containing protein [Sphingopyxis sp.]|uniref:DUF7146 domain-containing protein n=1 Tax=Sphingopyxis sp. TaxID=1908224 RepID=UPI001A212E1A|nr:toprim domain-containing protein [Sphingopyxis sp.]MBJ7500897.1 toprim domain-containing protein [Sphingopyxis sp.]